MWPIQHYGSYYCNLVFRYGHVSSLSVVGPGLHSTDVLLIKCRHTSRYTWSEICPFSISRNISQNGRGLCANVHDAPCCSELVFYWSVFSFCHPPVYVLLCFNRLTNNARHFYALLSMCIWMCVYSVYFVYILLLVEDYGHPEWRIMLSVCTYRL